VKKLISQSDALNVQINALEDNIVALTSLIVVQCDKDAAELLCDAFLTSFHKIKDYYLILKILDV
jgi:hypothetical protein